MVAAPCDGRQVSDEPRGRKLRGIRRGGAAFYGDSGADGRGLVRAIGRGSMARTIGVADVDPIGGALRFAAWRNGVRRLIVTRNLVRE